MASYFTDAIDQTFTVMIKNVIDTIMIIKLYFTTFSEFINISDGIKAIRLIGIINVNINESDFLNIDVGYFVMKLISITIVDRSIYPFVKNDIIEPSREIDAKISEVNSESKIKSNIYAPWIFKFITAIVTMIIPYTISPNPSSSN